ncbi:MAG: acetone carboxylase subunit gamma [Gammaproteobacteria bacterium]
MRVNITEYLSIELDNETWMCRVCDHELGPARENYKRGLLLHNRKLDEVHPHLLDPELYPYTFCPDPAYTALIEYYCPSCGTMVETEYTVPGHPLAHDIELDIDDLKKKAAEWGEQTHPPEIPEHQPPRHHHDH